MRILVVDDDAALRDSLCESLGALGHEVVSAGKGREALRLARSRRPAVALVDLCLPDLDGIIVAKTLRQLAPDHLRVVAFTGWGGDLDDVLADSSPFDEIVEKPAALDSIHRALTNADRELNC